MLINLATHTHTATSFSYQLCFLQPPAAADDDDLLHDDIFFHQHFCSLIDDDDRALHDPDYEEHDSLGNTPFQI